MASNSMPETGDNGRAFSIAEGADRFAASLPGAYQVPLEGFSSGRDPFRWGCVPDI